MTIDNVLEILEKHKLRIPSNVFYELKANIVNFEDPTTKNDLGVDCISRDDVRDVMQELWGTSGELMDRLMALPSVTPQLSSELEKNSKKLEKDFGESDCIDRAELLKAMDTWDKFGYTETGCFVREPKGDYVPYVHYEDMVNCVNGMPSVTPQEPRKGHWIVEKGGSYLGRRNGCCSVCKDFYTNDWNLMNYCPNCGADMREVEE